MDQSMGTEVDNKSYKKAYACWILKGQLFCEATGSTGGQVLQDGI